MTTQKHIDDVGVPEQGIIGTIKEELMEGKDNIARIKGVFLNAVKGYVIGVALVALPAALIVTSVNDSYDKKLKAHFNAEIQPFWDRIEQKDKEIQELRKAELGAIRHFRETIQKAAQEIDKKQDQADVIAIARTLVSERDGIRSSIDAVNNGLNSEFSKLENKISQKGYRGEEVSKLVNEVNHSWARKKEIIFQELNKLEESNRGHHL
jgi:hypothetical protein